MKVFIVFTVALAYASAYNGPQHHTVIGKGGVPVDTVEVQHARSAHLAQLAAAQADASFRHTETPINVQKVEYSGPLYHGPQHFPVIDKHGVPVETLEVQHAKAAHFAATKLAAANAHSSIGHSEAPINAQKVEYSEQLYHGPQHIPVIDKHGVPVETLEVQHAKAVHLAATKLAAAKSQEYSHEASAEAVAYNVEHKTPAYHGPQHIAVIGKNGVPVDTAEVQHLRAAHLAVYEAQKHH